MFQVSQKFTSMSGPYVGIQSISNAKYFGQSKQQNLW